MRNRLRRYFVVFTVVIAAATLAACGPTPAQLESYRRAAGNTLVVTAILGSGDTIESARVVAETAQRVTIEVLINKNEGIRIQVAIPTEVEVQLAEPLGDREVFEAGSDVPLPELTTP